MQGNGLTLIMIKYIIVYKQLIIASLNLFFPNSLHHKIVRTKIQIQFSITEIIIIHLIYFEENLKSRADIFFYKQMLKSVILTI